MIMQVHDELVFEVPEDEVEWVRTEIPRLMAGVAELRVPLLAEIGVGPELGQGALTKLAPRLRALRVASPTPCRGQHQRPGGAGSAVFPEWNSNTLDL